MARSSVIVVGAGVAGLACALELAERGLAVEIVERGRALGDGACSWMAGGMLAPWCERATTEPEVVTWGALSVAWWAERFPGTVQNGSLVVAQSRDAPDLARFAARTERFEWVDAERVATLEPDLAGRFRRALFFPDEAHLDPRRALASLAETLRRRGVAIRFGVELGADLRPAFPDNLPQVRRSGRVLHANGLFRHGFLLAPALARRVADAALDPTFKSEAPDADLPQRRRA